MFNTGIIGRQSNIIALVRLFIGDDNLSYYDIKTIFDESIEKIKSWLKPDTDLDDVRLEFLVASVINYEYVKLTTPADINKADKLLKDYADLCKTLLKDDIRDELGV